MKSRTSIFDGGKARILSIDDDIAWSTCLSEILGRAGYTIECCDSGSAARESLQQQTPDLIIADIDLGRENGLQLCEEIRAMPEAADVPILFLSGADIQDVVERAHQVGGTYYLRKPFDPEVLLDLVDRALWLPHVVGNRARETAAAL